MHGSLMLAIILGLVIKTGRNTARLMARGAFRPRREADGILLASSMRSDRARRDRLHDVPVLRGRGLPWTGGIRSCQDRHLSRLANCWLAGNSHPVAAKG
jgi:hypothetical protein